MKGMVVTLCILMTVGLIWSNRETIQRFINQEPDRVVYRQVETVGGSPDEYLASAKDETEWERRYLFLRTNGMWKSGVEDVDEAVSASVHLRDHPGRWYPKRWRDKLTDGKAWVEKQNGDGPDEEFIDASDDTPPAWVGKPLGRNAKARKPVSTSKALSRFIFGMEEE